ncbi:hypothetical protein [Nocardia sp. NPDC024068]|uniref:hypothetical protein n=1 Tax=Nocardia sp. NPDC024068 TaxID=3157197 RepID=UPI0033CED25A
MSGRDKVLFATEVDVDRPPVLTDGPLELKLVEALPDMCSEHGLPSVEDRPFVVNSQGMPLSEIPTARVFLRSMRPPWRPDDNYGIQARLRFDCPACEFCLQDVKRYRRIAQVALLAVVAVFAGLAVAVPLHLEQLYVPLALAVVPGCFFALAVAVVSWSRSGFFADVWLTHETEHLIVSAHPDFVAAVDQLRAESPD